MVSGGGCGENLWCLEPPCGSLLTFIAAFAQVEPSNCFSGSRMQIQYRLSFVVVVYIPIYFSSSADVSLLLFTCWSTVVLSPSDWTLSFTQAVRPPLATAPLLQGRLELHVRRTHGTCGALSVCLARLRLMPVWPNSPGSGPDRPTRSLGYQARQRHFAAFLIPIRL